MQPAEVDPRGGPDAPVVLRTPGGSLIAFRHADGSVTRFANGTRFRLEADTDDGAVINLESGASWHRVAPAAPEGPGYRLHVTAGTVRLDDATAILVCEGDGECFVGTVSGRVEVTPRSGAPVVVDPARVAWLASDGDRCLLFDDMALDELEDEVWIRANLDLDHELELAVAREAMHAIPAVVSGPARRAVDPDEHLAPAGAPPPHRAPPRRRRALPYLLLALVLGAAAGPACGAALMGAAAPQPAVGAPLAADR